MFCTHVLPDRRIVLRFHYEDTDQASVAGTFSDWEPVPMEPDGDGWWQLVVGPVPEGDYQYKFVVHGQWFYDQYNFRRTRTSENSFVHVGTRCGHLLRRSFRSDALGATKKLVAYLPPSWSLHPDRTYPSLMLLPGLLDDETTWARKTSLEEVADHLIAADAMPEMVILCPDKDDTMFHEEQWNYYASYLAEDVRHLAETEYRAIPGGDARAVEGLSLGGAWALRLAAGLPDRYVSVSGLSCAFSGELVDSFRTVAERLAERRVRFRLAYGDGEGEALSRATHTFAELLRKLGLEVETTEDRGIHDWPLWREQIPHSLQFHGWTFAHRP